MSLFGLFKKKPMGILGVDIGAGGVKVVELAPEGKRMRLFTYGYTEGTLPAAEADDAAKREAGIKLLKATLRAAKTKGTGAVAAVPLSQVFSAVVTTPKVQGKELKELVLREAQKFIPLPVADVLIDYKVVARKGAPHAERKEQEVLITAAPKRTVSLITDTLKGAGLTLKAIETEAFALIRSLVGNDPSLLLIVDIGESRTNLLVVEQGLPVSHRSLHGGGRDFTRALTSHLHVGEAQAETLKLDFAELGGVERGASGFPKLFEQMVAPLASEIRSTIAHLPTPPDRIILTGGSSLIPNLDAYLTSLFNLKVYIGDPWARVLYPAELQSTLHSMGARFAVAVGLALRT